MTDGDLDLSLDTGFKDSGLTTTELWTCHIAVGGTIGMIEFEAYVCGALRPNRFQHDVIAQALNEYFLEVSGAWPVRYSDDESA